MNENVRNAKALAELCAQIAPHAKIESITPLGPDADVQDADGTEKAIGYGVPLRIVLRTNGGERRDLCLHTAKPDEFGHDRRADRAANMLLSYDTFDSIPRHTRAIDVGAVTRGGKLISLRDSNEFYLITEFVEGHVYAEDLRRIAHRESLSPEDESRTRALALLLAEIHAEKRNAPILYRRAIRDLLGSGEGIFGLVDGYPDNVPMAPPERLLGIERKCLEWRFRLKQRTHRLARTHGDFHPFNILFDRKGQPALLDTSRGSVGDPADDVMCLALNYVFFALEAPGSWAPALGKLWRLFFQTYIERTGDTDIFSVGAPFLAWRALVMANPRWYPSIRDTTRDALLGFVERALDARSFDPNDAERLFP
ncbi:MAG: aminoglycoside phosphotransferase family protein [Polyangiaceae bacterium]|nr:aminoglycoside phosphotransferase family protein [Polyangiaceae bacterium]